MGWMRVGGHVRARGADVEEVHLRGVWMGARRGAGQKNEVGRLLEDYCNQTNT